MIWFYILLVISQLENHHLLGMDLFAGLTIFKVLGAVCALYAFWYTSSSKTSVGLTQTRQGSLFLVFYFIVVGSFIFKNQGGSLLDGVLMKFTSILLLYFVVMATVDSVRKLRIVLLCIVGSVAIAGFYVVKEWVQYRNVFGSDFRPSGASLDSNYFALSVATCLPIAFCLFLERKARWQRLLCLGCIGMMLLGFVAASSRGGFFAMVAALLTLSWYSKRRTQYFGILLVLVAPLMILAPSSPVRRLLNPGYGEKVGEDSRKATWNAGMRMAVQNPFTGVGIGNFKSLVVQYQDADGNEVKTLAHNTYVEIAAELGIPTLVVFLAILLFTYRSVDRVRRRSGESGPVLIHQASLGIEAATVGCAVGMIFLSAHWEKLLWLLVFLSCALPALMARISRSSLLRAHLRGDCGSGPRQAGTESKLPVMRERT